MTNRRKSRSGSSLEREDILEEEKLPSLSDAVWRPISDPISCFRPPIAIATKDVLKQASDAGVRQPVKDRWRQILEEADRVPYKHLLTLQRGVSSTQFKQMNSSGIRLVVPSALHTSYPKEVQGSLPTFADFIARGRARE
ncbi:MAG: hypothetical protein IPF77_13265 [Gemmatimonadetes bacterium]|nr:hypothetical protein [Gemmatimonadota bacterium]